MSAKLFVGGLSYSTTFDGLRDHFAQCGNVKSALVVTDPYSGRSRGFGFVEMSTEDEANTAIDRLNGQTLDGRSLKIEMARPRVGGSGEMPRAMPRRPQMAGRGGSRGAGGGGGRWIGGRSSQ
jgi:RNA recognition motif-containing protein